ncbi:two-component system, OmpR family, sensor kinase [Duganella sp. CF402]|uniref:ATP-binding protein n=1 Tax=unclassified Duganella TaxID=2636909 RepID=UPI0008BE21CE|nr:MULTISPECIES: ATP-binding protein [unclassified Duganella]RZT10288.1 two-component system OmpR family sensor kinase [Duganella sp. BK701]SEL20196.1 two-component system, OmpR family, sensor kinase [Duganella sp. CF402]
MKTIRRQLLIGLLGATLVCVLGAGALLYRALRMETNELADLQLRQLAVAPESGSPLAEDPEEEFVLQRWDDSSGRVEVLHTSHGLRPLPRLAVSGFTTTKIDGHHWRIYGERQHTRYVQVAQPLAIRNKLAAEMALRSGTPLVFFALLLGALLVVVVGRALRPLERLAQAVEGRSASSLEPLSTQELSPELQPVVLALNSLMQKFDEALTAQRTFVADAAHELRSPLTALKLQLQLVERATTDEARALALAKLDERLDRSTHLVRQLLSLARHESTLAATQHKPVDLGRLLESVVADHSTLAESRNIDLGIEAPCQLVIDADEDALRVLLNNLVDNALRYTQEGGRVDLQACREDGRALLRVRDNGPGVPLEYRSRLFDRFFRPDGQQAWGAGLGLSIVRNIADHHQAEIVLSDGLEGRGLSVSVLF